uniref:Uncharacterized protein n=1 Tax=Mola mola TaxID=94237 RepID=A0A3Q3W1Z1_MOLML
MNTRWMFMVLLGCRLLHASLSWRSCTCNGNVSVPCPWSHAEQLKFNLLQDGRIIYMHRTCRNGGNAPDCEPNNTRMGVEVQENTENKSVSFLLTGVNASSHGIYRCEGIVMFPPPLVSVPSDLGILGHIYFFLNFRTDGDKNCGFHWIWIIVLLSSYSIVATSGTVFFWVKLRRTDSQSDYMNTIPKPTRERRKKRVQISIPRHF